MIEDPATAEASLEDRRHSSPVIFDAGDVRVDIDRQQREDPRRAFCAVGDSREHQVSPAPSNNATASAGPPSAPDRHSIRNRAGGTHDARFSS